MRLSRLILIPLLVACLLGVIAALPGVGRTDAQSPTRRSQFLTFGSLDLPEGGCCLSVSGDRAALGIGDQLVIVDVSDATAPVVAARIEIPGGVAATALFEDKLYVSHAGGGFSVYHLGADPLPSLKAHLADILPASDIALSGSVLLLAHGAHLSAVDITDASDPKPRHALTMPSAIQHVAVSGSTAVVSATDLGMIVVDSSDPTMLQVRSVLTVTGTAANVDLVGDRAFLTEWEYRPWPVGVAVDRDNRPMPPVAMTSRVHVVDVTQLDRPVRTTTLEYDEPLQGLHHVASGTDRLYVAGPTYAPATYAWQLISIDLLADPVVDVGYYFRGGGGWPMRGASLRDLALDSGFIYGLEHFYEDGGNGTTLLIMRPAADFEPRVWLPMLYQAE